MRDMVQAGFLGRKSGKGIFMYEKGKKSRDVNVDALEILKKYSLEPRGSFEDEDKTLRMVTRLVLRSYRYKSKQDYIYYFIFY